MPYHVFTKEREERRASMVLYAGTLVLMLILLYATYANIQRYHVAVVKARGYSMALLELESAFSVIQDKEIGVRGYLLTTDSAFLEPYRVPKDKVRKHFDLADSLLNINSFKVRTATLREMGATVSHHLEKLVRIESTAIALGPLEAQWLQREQDAMDMYREAHEAFVADVRRERALLLTGDLRKGLNAPGMVLVYSLLAMLATALLFWRLNRALSRAEKAGLELSGKVTELDQQTRDLADAQYMLQEVLDNSPNGIMTLAAVRDGTGSVFDLEFVTMNRQARIVMNEIDMHGERLLNEMGSEVDKDRFACYLEVIETGTPYRSTFKRKVNDVSFWYTDQVVRFNDGIMVTFTDVTEQQRLEELAAEGDRQLLTGQVMRTVAHEVRNPLTNIQLALEEVQDSINEGPEELEPFIAIIKRNSDRIGRLIKEMLESSQKRELKLVPCKMEDIVAAVLRTIRDRLELKDMVDHVDIPQDLPEFMADSELMHLAINNIAVNAIEAMDPDRGELVIKAYLQGGDIAMDISDNGKGIPPEQMEQLFTPFFSGRTGGLGLGLTATRSILNSHRVQLSVRSDVGKGTTFTLLFPKEILVDPGTSLD